MLGFGSRRAGLVVVGAVSSRLVQRRSNEWTMIHRETHRKGIVQVKTGQTPVDINELVTAADADTDTFAFSTAGLYSGDRTRLTEVLTSDALLRMAAAQPQLLPARIRFWFELAAG